MNADNLKDAVVAWNQGAGRPHKSVIRNDDRYNYAMEVAKILVWKLKKIPYLCMVKWDSEMMEK